MIGKLGELEDRVFALEEKVRRGAVEKTRHDGTEPFSIDGMGDIKMFWGTTGEIANSGTGQAWLTRNRKPGGNCLFSKIPNVQVFKDETGVSGGIARASNPPTMGGNFHVSNVDGDFDVAVKWHAANELWYVEVTNNSGATADFVVLASGV